VSSSTKRLSQAIVYFAVVTFGEVATRWLASLISRYAFSDAAGMLV